MRFRTQYFLYRYRKPKTEEVLHGEIVDLAWLTAVEARRRWRSGELDTSTPVGFALRQLCHYPPHEWADALCRVPNTASGVPGRFELRPGIHMIPVRTDTLPPATHTNCVVVGEDVQVIVDPGASDPAEQHALLEQIRHLDTGHSTILSVLLTHSHRDHIGAAAFLREALGCPVWAHGATAAQLNLSIDRHLDDGEILELPGEPAWRIRCIHTPGHDPGHLAFLEENSGVLIAGDMVANPGSIYIAPGLGGDMTAYLDSLERLKRFAFDRIVPAHGVPLHHGARDLIDRHIHHRLTRERKVQHALALGLRSIEDLLSHVYDDIHEAAFPLAEGNLRAHLTRLGVSLP
jgi:glyoxylase-like metal-dependent hydrolase (beta-lactamase superfamily II)